MNIGERRNCESKFKECKKWKRKGTKLTRPINEMENECVMNSRETIFEEN